MLGELRLTPAFTCTVIHVIAIVIRISDTCNATLLMHNLDTFMIATAASVSNHRRGTRSRECNLWLAEWLSGWFAPLPLIPLTCSHVR